MKTYDELSKEAHASVDVLMASLPTPKERVLASRAAVRAHAANLRALLGDAKASEVFYVLGDELATL